MIERYENYRRDFIRRSIDTVQDPLYLTFGVRFEFFPRADLSDSLSPGLLTGDARRYLQARGDTLRVQKLDYFQNLLRRFSVDEPWWFTEISDISNLLDFAHGGARLKDNAKIKIEARESLDMKFLSFMESYRSIEFDKVFMREILPSNLKRFDMSIFLTDIRVLTKQNEDGDKVYDDDSQGVIVLKLQDCEFDFTDYGDFANGVGNTNEPGITKHNFDIKVRRIYESYNLPTGFLFGYSGDGYFSEDDRNDFNFISNVLRPKAMLMAEIGNERKMKEEEFQEYIDNQREEIINEVEETREVERKIEDGGQNEIFVEGNQESDTEIDEKQPEISSSPPPEQELTTLESKTRKYRNEVDPSVLEIISKSNSNRRL